VSTTPGTKGLTIEQRVNLDGETFTIRAIRANRFTGETCVHVSDERGGMLVLSPAEVSR